MDNEIGTTRWHMRNYIVDLDKLYQDELKKNADKKISKDFSIYVPLIVKIYGTQNGNFLIKKNEFTKYLYIKNGCRVYFSDADIIDMILQVKREQTLQNLIISLADAYHGNFDTYRIVLGQNEYEVKGIPQIKENQILVNHQDIDISFEDLFILVNLIISKDYAASPLWEGKPSFLKQTLVKYISLLKLYYESDVAAREYLVGMGYDVDKRIHENYADQEMRDEKNNYFCDFNVFEESGIL